MNPTEVVLNPQTGQLRSGWRAAVFFALLASPLVIYGLLPKASEASRQPVTSINPGFETILSYCIYIIWTVAISWICLRLLEKMRISSLGFALRGGWFGDVLKGCLIGALMIALVVAIQMAAGASRLRFNPVLQGANGVIWTGAREIASELLATTALLILAADFEELIFRGYAFQTLLRGAPAVIPILIFSVYFGWAHWQNPNRTIFSTVNTALAGVWLSTAYLRTRNLWFPTALHFMWNWTMGAFFGIPVSGLQIGRPLLNTSTNGPVWLTGGSYGSEGGAAATLTLILATVIIWRAKWLRVAPETTDSLLARTPNRENGVEPISLRP